MCECWSGESKTVFLVIEVQLHVLISPILYKPPMLLRKNILTLQLRCYLEKAVSDLFDILQLPFPADVH